MSEGKHLPFFQVSPFVVRDKQSASGEWRKPDVYISDELRFLRIKLAKLGYYGGSPALVGRAPVTDVMDIIAYESFEADYEITERELNNE